VPNGFEVLVSMDSERNNNNNLWIKSPMRYLHRKLMREITNKFFYVYYLYCGPRKSFTVTRRKHVRFSDVFDATYTLNGTMWGNAYRVHGHNCNTLSQYTIKYNNNNRL